MNEPNCNASAFKANWRLALAIGLIASIAFALLASINLTAQGLYYDEVHQAAAAFAYKGKDPTMFNAVEVRGIPVLNMTYSGAIKSNIYGLYLRYLGSNFTVRSWRLLGIGFVAIGIVMFCVIAGPLISLGSLVIFLLLMLTDASLILTTRHDWGPTALALLIRLIFIAVWIAGELSQKAIATKGFALGALVGIAVFEKLSSVVLLVPLCIVFILIPSRRTIRNWLVCSLGLLIGSMPLIAVNLWSYVNRGWLISLAAINEPQKQSLSFDLLSRFAYDYLSLGQGVRVRHWILGDPANSLQPPIEMVLIVASCLFVGVVSIRLWNSNRLLQMSGVMTLCYFAVGIALLILPRTTDAHHWLIGTPFQYAAIALAFAGLLHQMPARAHRQVLFRKAFLAAVVALLTLRLPSVVAIERSLGAGRTSGSYDPSFSKIAEFATHRAHEAIFIAADWGIAAQIYCMSGGQPHLVFDPFWDRDGWQQVRGIVEGTDKDILYLLQRRGWSSPYSANTARIRDEIEKLPGWQEVPVEPEAANLKTFDVRKFQRTVRLNASR